MASAIDATLEVPLAPQASWTANPLVLWLLTEGWNRTDAAEIVQGLCDVMEDENIPIHRVRMILRTMHPQVAGISFTWSKDTKEVKFFSATHEVMETAAFLDSPLHPIFEGAAAAIRRQLDTPDATLDFPILEELIGEGATDYLVLPITFSDGQIHAITLTSDRPGGFSDHELHMITEAVTVLARPVEVFATKHMARTLLNTYLGKGSGGRVLNGLIRRGDGVNIHAVIWYCDLRASTSLAESHPGDAFMEILNDYFECMAGAVLDNDGEILRFIGDAVLAIFPIEGCTDHPEKCPAHIGACHNAMAAVKDARERLSAVNERRHSEEKPTLQCGIGLHLGDVMYGNIGVPDRLEFTVIGAAANEASRVETLCKSLERSVLASADFARVIPGAWVSVGSHALRGVREPMEIFALVDEKPTS